MSDDNRASCGCPTYWVEHPTQPYGQCPYCEIESLTAQLEEVKEQLVYAMQGRRNAMDKADLAGTQLTEAKEEIERLRIYNVNQSIKLLDKIERLEAKLSRYEKKCECSLRTRAVGDGCEVCNPEYAIDQYKMTIDDLKEELARYEGGVTAEVVCNGDGWDASVANVPLPKEYRYQRVRVIVMKEGV